MSENPETPAQPLTEAEKAIVASIREKTSRPLMDFGRNRERKYCGVVIYPGGATLPRFIATHGRIILFDTLAIAQNVLPPFGGGRETVFNLQGDIVYWTPLDPKGINRAAIITRYDPYNVPAGHSVPSETHGKEWRHHVMWFHVFTDCGQMRRREDGTYANLALGEDPKESEDPRWIELRGTVPREETHDEAMAAVGAEDETE